jgi:hypothetical protein
VNFTCHSVEFIHRTALPKLAKNIWLAIAHQPYKQKRLLLSGETAVSFHQRFVCPRSILVVIGPRTPEPRLSRVLLFQQRTDGVQHAWIVLVFLQHQQRWLLVSTLELVDPPQSRTVEFTERLLDILPNRAGVIVQQIVMVNSCDERRIF